ncbi:hypothetical protein BASA62_002723 [Batrachochytrium salamandrivorans]|nr:hypothetical protein BASA62_002723 [Batrachochytrium salamandrivorans]
MSLEHVSVSCNRTSHAVDWSAEGLVAFAAGSFVCLYQSQSSSKAGVSQTLKGHSATVTCVSFILPGKSFGYHNICNPSSESNLIVSTSADKTCIVWRRTTSGEWLLSCRVDAHTQGVVALAVVQGRENFNEDGDWIATAASDGTTNVWRRTDDSTGKDKLDLVQTICMGHHHMMALGLAFLPNSKVPVLFSAGTDMKLHVHVFENGVFTTKLSLPGHNGWIRSIKIATYTDAGSGDKAQKHSYEDGCLMIATASQDRHIRIWKLVASPNSALTVSDSAATKSSSSINEVDNRVLALQDMNLEDVDGCTQLSTKSHSILVNNESVVSPFTIMLDALLTSHDDWVYSVNWHPAVCKNDSETGAREYQQPMSLISASADKSIMIWQPDDHSESWIYQARLGEVGGATFGFYGALLSPSGDTILSNGYNGALHTWKRKGSDYTNWSPAVGVSGHSSAVKCLAWDPTGTFLLSTGSDQTTRAIAPWRHDDIVSWHEIGRPQIHGYDINCLAFVHTYQFISGADEKVLRVFSAPRAFAISLENITGIKGEIAKLQLGACLPALGLSNKAVFEDTTSTHSSNEQPSLSAFSALAGPHSTFSDGLSQPPFEEHLLQHTLWPETDKLYGHGYEIMTVASNNEGTLVASACKAAKAEHAVVRLWSTATWKEICEPLAFHSLTVTSIQFSPDGKYVLTAGRDRGWALFYVGDALKDGSWSLEASQIRAHTRIIWSAKWIPDCNYFVTASRDKQVKIWEKINSEWSSVATLKFDESVTMIDICRMGQSSRYLLAAGLETGNICLQQIWIDSDGKWKSAVHDEEIPITQSHSLAITGLSWRPVTLNQHDTSHYLASCSDDHSVRIFKII